MVTKFVIGSGVTGGLLFIAGIIASASGVGAVIGLPLIFAGLVLGAVPAVALTFEVIKSHWNSSRSNARRVHNNNLITNTVNRVFSRLSSCFSSADETFEQKEDVENIPSYSVTPSAGSGFFHGLFNFFRSKNSNQANVSNSNNKLNEASKSQDHTTLRSP